MSCKNCKFGNTYYTRDTTPKLYKVECLYPYTVEEIVQGKASEPKRGIFKKPFDECKGFEFR